MVKDPINKDEQTEEVKKNVLLKTQATMNILEKESTVMLIVKNPAN